MLNLSNAAHAFAMCKEKLVTGRNAGIAITHGATLRFFSPLGQHVPPIITKFGTAGRPKASYAMRSCT